VIEVLTPIQQRYREIRSDDAALLQQLRRAADRLTADRERDVAMRQKASGSANGYQFEYGRLAADGTAPRPHGGRQPPAAALGQHVRHPAVRKPLRELREQVTSLASTTTAIGTPPADLPPGR